ncbi:unnamed protein product [Rangifer tarandus platyrhynchus]|uniref:Uncharacterized protein n=1 Tax=Rangifer tarandus platyrhynchus TaxID=3082113 RepID=A0AC59ZEY5_RANTA
MMPQVPCSRLPGVPGSHPKCPIVAATLHMEETKHSFCFSCRVAFSGSNSLQIEGCPSRVTAPELGSPESPGSGSATSVGHRVDSAVFPFLRRLQKSIQISFLPHC